MIANASEFVDLLSDLFSKQGFFVNAGFDYRECQHNYAKDVALWLVDERPFSLVEADTGIGKSVVNIVSLMLFNHWSKKRVFLSTKTLHLQKQLFESDLPMANKAMKHLGIMPLRITRRVGIRQFVDPERVTIRQNELFKDRPVTGLWKRFSSWALDTSINGTGLIEEWFEDYDESLPEELSSSDICLLDSTKATPAVERMRDDVNNADLVITTHASLVHDAVTNGSILDKSESGYGAIICDEGDQCIEVAKNYFQRRLRPQEISHYINQISGNKRFKEGAIEELERLNDSMIAFDTSCKSAIFCGDGESIDAELITHLPKIEKNLTKAVKKTSGNIDLQSQLMDFRDYVSCYLNDIVSHTPRQLRAVAYSKVRRYPSLMTYSPLPGTVFKYFAKEGGKILFTSATLSDGAHDELTFHDMTSEMLLPASKIAVMSRHSPEKYGEIEIRRMKTDCPKIFTEEGLFNDEWIDNIVAMIVEAGQMGPTLVLTGSFDETAIIKNRLSKCFDPEKTLAHEQGTNVKSYITKFRRLGGVLISPSVWEGISIRKLNGNQLFRNLVISRIPFPPPSASEEELFVSQYITNVAGADEKRASRIYRHKQHSAGIRKGRQGFGRLIRSMLDEGVLWLGDPRFPMQKKKGFTLLLRVIPKRFLDNYSDACDNIMNNDKGAIATPRTATIHQLWGNR